MAGQDYYGAIAGNILDNLALHLDDYRRYSRSKSMAKSARRAAQMDQLARIMGWVSDQNKLQGMIDRSAATKAFADDATGESQRRGRLADAARGALTAVGDEDMPSAATNQVVADGTDSAAATAAALRALEQGFGNIGLAQLDRGLAANRDRRAFAELMPRFRDRWDANIGESSTKLGHTKAITSGLRMLGSAARMGGSMMGGGSDSTGGSGVWSGLLKSFVKNGQGGNSQFLTDIIGGWGGK